MRTAFLGLCLPLLGCSSGPRNDPPVGTIVRAAETPPPGAGAPCPDDRCAEGLTCLRYYGVAGPRGPRLTSCEIPCSDGKCPEGKSCVTISDGPGAVCR